MQIRSKHGSGILRRDIWNLARYPGTGYELVLAMSTRVHPFGSSQWAASDGDPWNRAGMRSTELVTSFWEDVWNAHRPDAVDRFLADDVVVEASGREIAGKENVKQWVQQFLGQVNNLHIEVLQTFQNEDGSRVTSRFMLTGDNNGIFGTNPNGKPIALPSIAVWSVNDGKLQHGWVEQASIEIYRSLLA